MKFSFSIKLLQNIRKVTKTNAISTQTKLFFVAKANRDHFYIWVGDRYYPASKMLTKHCSMIVTPNKAHDIHLIFYLQTRLLFCRMIIRVLFNLNLFMSLTVAFILTGAFAWAAKTNYFFFKHYTENCTYYWKYMTKAIIQYFSFFFSLSIKLIKEIVDFE